MSQLQTKCPQCGLLTLYSTANAFRPFCSDRCKLIDLGEWASEKYAIPVKSTSDYTTDLNADEFNYSQDPKHQSDDNSEDS